MTETKYKSEGKNESVDHKEKSEHAHGLVKTRGYMRQGALGTRKEKRSLSRLRQALTARPPPRMLFHGLPTEDEPGKPAMGDDVTTPGAPKAWVGEDACTPKPCPLLLLSNEEAAPLAG